MTSTYSYATVADSKGKQINLPPFMTQHVIDAVNHRFTVRDDDVFIVTYPRSGTTWTQQVVHLLTNNGVQGDRHLEIVIPYLEKVSAFDGIEIFEQINSRRYFKTHLPYSMDVHHKNPNAKVIYVARNPKDCAVSCYCFWSNNSRIAYDGSWDDYFNLLIKGDTLYGDWFDHVLDWWQASLDSGNIYFIKYEDMQADLKGFVTQIAGFIDIPATPALIDKIVKMSTFSHMAGDSNTNLDWAAWRPDASARPLRKGKVGDWKNHFTDEQNAVFDKLYRERMQGTGLDFDFGERI
ncbi:MAG: sulfotransferase domain-containing protein [Desulfosalsimonadaceae bacterium]|nr:sulfotransferase domain-containing protein [Desulfosalsimonadaceae bacterium]